MSNILHVALLKITPALPLEGFAVRFLLRMSIAFQMSCLLTPEKSDTQLLPTQYTHTLY